MEPIKEKSCRNCNDLFQPDSHNATRQEYCCKPECRRASKADSQKRWTEKPENRNYFCGPTNVQRVQEWRKEHPGYRRRKSGKTVIALQETLNAQPAENMRHSRSAFRCVTRYLKSTTYCFIYPSTQEGMLAVERKEVDGKAGSYSALKPFIDRGLVQPMLRCRVSLPGIEKLPVNEDLTNDKTGKTLMALLAAGDQIGRPFVAPPKTPDHIMQILRDAFANVSKDSQLQEESKKFQMDVQYVPMPECMQVLKFVLNQPSEVINEFGKYLKF